MKKQWQPHFLGLLMVLVISQTLFAQQNKMKLVSSIQTIEEIFGLVYPGNQTGVHMTMSGMVEEWDSTFHFTMRYDLREIDLSMAEIVQDETGMELYIDLLCKQQQNCIKLTAQGRKPSYYSSAQAFAMPASEERKLAEILIHLRIIQQNLSR